MACLFRVIMFFTGFIIMMCIRESVPDTLALNKRYFTMRVLVPNILEKSFVYLRKGAFRYFKKASWDP